MVGRTPWWVVVSSIGAPVFLIGGFAVAARLQPAAYDSGRDTISSLAGLGAQHRWVMTLGLVGLGGCQLITALGLRPAARVGRLLLALGGIATLLVSALPLPRVGTSQSHGIAALVAFLALALWPAFAPGSSATEVPWGLRRRVGIGATVLLLLLVGWFGLTLLEEHLVGLAERIAAGAEAVWPLAVVISWLWRAQWPGATEPRTADHRADLREYPPRLQ